VVDPESESGATIFRAVPNNDDDTDNDNDDINSNNNKSQKIIVACRGSANPKNFGTNLKFNLVPANRLSQNYIPENALVHDGFQSASVGLWKELSQPLEKLLNNGDDNETTTEIVFTGHSLGAATGESATNTFSLQRDVGFFHIFDAPHLFVFVIILLSIKHARFV